VTVFRDLRSGQTAEGWNVDRPATAMSTAEVVAVSNAISRQTAFFREQTDPVSLIPGHLLGVVMKDDSSERDRLLAYWDGPVRRRAESGEKLFERLFELRTALTTDH
ncbi:MAG: AAA family ATPase, partial [Planctomycetota bacterium]